MEVSQKGEYQREVPLAVTQVEATYLLNLSFLHLELGCDHRASVGHLDRTGHLAQVGLHALLVVRQVGVQHHPDRSLHGHRHLFQIHRDRLGLQIHHLGSYTKCLLGYRRSRLPPQFPRIEA